MADFYEGLCDHLNTSLKAAADEIRKLREENKRLRAELKDRDPQLWELAEHIACLELKLISAGLDPSPTSASTDRGTSK